MLEDRALPYRKSSSAAQINYILNLWSKNSTFKDIFSLLKLAKKILKRDIEELEDLSYKEASALIAVIKKLKPPKPANDAAYGGTV